MFFWFVGTAIITVGVVFRDPRFDYRLLIVGSVIPIADGLLGGAFLETGRLDVIQRCRRDLAEADRLQVNQPVTS